MMAEINGTRPLKTVNLFDLQQKINTEVKEICSIENSCRKSFQKGIRDKDSQKLQVFYQILNSNEKMVFWKKKYGKSMVNFIKTIPGIKLVRPEDETELDIARSLDLHDENNNFAYPVFFMELFEVMILQKMILENNKEKHDYASVVLGQILNKYGFGGKTMNLETAFDEVVEYFKTVIFAKDKFQVPKRENKMRRGNLSVPSIKHAIKTFKSLEFHYYDFEDEHNDYSDLKMELKNWNHNIKTSFSIQNGDHVLFRELSESESGFIRGQIESTVVNEKEREVVFTVFYLDSGHTELISTSEYEIYPLPEEFSKLERRTDLYKLSGIKINEDAVLDKKVRNKMIKWFADSLWGKLCVFEHKPCPVDDCDYECQQAWLKNNNEIFLWKLSTSNAHDERGIVSNSEKSMNEEFFNSFQDFVQKI